MKGAIKMLIKLRQKGQIAIPKEIINKLGLSIGNQLEIAENNGTIYLAPVVTYPKNYLNKLKNEVLDVKEKIAIGELPTFDSVDDLFDKMDVK